MATIAILLSGTVIEDWLDSIGVSLESFRKEMLGSWVFGYVRALRLAEVQTVLFCISNRVATVSRFTHEPTGVTICVLPPPRLYKYLCRKFLNSFEERACTQSGNAWIAKGHHVLQRVLELICAYLKTPLLRLSIELIRAKCVAIVVQEYECPRFDMCVLLGRLLKISTFGCFQYEVHLPKWKLMNPFHLLSLRFCSGLIIAASSEVRRVKEQYRSIRPGKLAQIPNPVDLTVWYPISRSEARIELRIPSNAKVAVWHGQVELRKGVDVLVEAWNQICSVRPADDLRLLLIGAGSYSADLTSLIKERQLRGVLWLDNWVHDPTVIRRYLGCADVFVFPSRVEGFPVAPMEAMACGLPVVAADASGIEDILWGGEDSGGVVVARGDAGALARALGRLLDDTELARKLGERARRRAELSFSMENIGQHLSAFLLNSQPLHSSF